jgi:predicted nucleic acid-binding protein
MAGRAGRPLARPSAFWDASALVPLCVHQHITPQVIELYKAYEPAVWWTTPVEINGALARLVRMRQLATSDLPKSRQLLAELENAWFEIEPTDAVRTKAMELVARYDLRAADAFQLAAALVWCQGVPAGRIFLTADQRLREAAELSGFHAPPIN